MLSQIRTSRGELGDDFSGEEKKFGTKSLDMNKLIKYKKTVAKFNRATLEKHAKSEAKDITIVEEITEELGNGEEVLIKSTNLRPKRPHPTPTSMASASSAAAEIILRNAVLRHERAKKTQEKLYADIEKVNVSFYKNYLARKNQKKIQASYEAMVDNIIYVAAGAVVLAGVVQLAAVYAVPYLLQSLATSTAQQVAQTAVTSSIKSKIYDAIMSETTLKFINEVFLGLTPAQTNELTQKLGAVRGALTEIMRVESIRGKVLAGDFNIMEYAFNGKNPMSMMTQLEGTDLLPQDKEISVALKPFQDAVFGLRNFMIDRALGPIAGYALKTDVTALTAAVAKAADPAKLTNAASTLFSAVNGDPSGDMAKQVMKLLGVKDIAGVKLDNIVTLFRASTSVTNLRKAKNDFMTFYRQNKMSIDNVYALFTPPSKTNPPPKTGYFETIVQRAKGSTVLRGAFTNNFMAAFGFQMDNKGNWVGKVASVLNPAAPPPPSGTSGTPAATPTATETPAPTATPTTKESLQRAPQTLFTINSTVLYFRGKITPGNFLGYTSGVVYDSVTNKIQSGLQTLYPSAFAINSKPVEDEEEKERKMKEEEKFEEGMRKYRISLIEKKERGEGLKRLMKEAEIMNRPNGVVDPKDFQALEYAYLNVKLKTKQLMEKGLLFEPFFMWGTTASLQLFNEVATFHTKPKSGDSFLSFDVYGLTTEPFISTFRTYYAASSDTAFAKLANELNTSIQKIYNDTYENYIRKPLMDTDIVKYINENGRKKLNAATKKFLAKVYLGVYIEKVFTQITDLFFDTLINLPINFPSKVVGDFQMHFYNKYNINQYLTPNGWQFMTENLGGSKIGAMFNTVIKNVKEKGWTSASVQEGLANYMRYSEEEVYSHSMLISTPGWGTFSDMMFGTGKVTAEDMRRRQQAAADASDWLDFKRRLGESVEESKQTVEELTAYVNEVKKSLDDVNARGPASFLPHDVVKWQAECTYWAGRYMIANARLGKSVAVEYFTETYKWTIDKAEALQSTLYEMGDYVRMKTLSGIYSSMSGLIGDRGRATSVMLSVGDGVGIELRGRDYEAFMWQRRRDEFAIGLAEYYLQQPDPRAPFDDNLKNAYAAKLAADDAAAGRKKFDLNELEPLKDEIKNSTGKVFWSPKGQDNWNPLKSATQFLFDIGKNAGYNISCAAGGDCSGIPKMAAEGWLDRLTGTTIASLGAKFRAAGLQARKDADFLNINSSIERKKPNTQYATVGDRVFEIIVDKTQSSPDNVLGILLKEIKDGSASDKTTRSFDDLSALRAAIAGEILGEKATSDTLDSGQYIEITVPNNSLIGPAFYTTKITAGEYVQRRFAEVGALNMLAKSGVDTSTEDYKNTDLYKDLAHELQTNATFRDNMGAKELQDAAVLALNLQMQTTIDGWKTPDGGPDTVRKESAKQALEFALAGNKSGLTIDRDLISLYHQRDEAIAASGHAYHAAMAALPNHLKAAMQANTREYLKKTKGQLNESKAELAKLAADLEKSNADPCATVSQEDAAGFREAYNIMKTEVELVGNTDNYTLQSYNDALGSEDGKGSSNCDPKRASGALDRLKAKEKVIDEKLALIERYLENTPPDITLITRQLGKLIDLTGVRNSVYRLIEGKTNYNHLFNPDGVGENGKSFKENLKAIIQRSANALATNAKQTDEEAKAASENARKKLESEYATFQMKNATTNSRKANLASKIDTAANLISYEQLPGEDSLTYFRRIKDLAAAANARRDAARALSQDIDALFAGFYTGEDGKNRLLAFKAYPIEPLLLPVIPTDLIGFDGPAMEAFNNSIPDMRQEISEYNVTVAAIDKLNKEINDLAPESEMYNTKAQELAKKISELDNSLGSRARDFIRDYEKEKARLGGLLLNLVDQSETTFLTLIQSNRQNIKDELDAVENAILGLDSITLSKAEKGKYSTLTKERLETMLTELSTQITNIDLHTIRYADLRTDIKNGKLYDIQHSIQSAGEFAKEFATLLRGKPMRLAALKDYNALITEKFNEMFIASRSRLRANKEANINKDKNSAEKSYGAYCRKYCNPGTKIPSDKTDPEIRQLMSSLMDVINTTYSDINVPNIDSTSWANSIANLVKIDAAAADALDPAKLDATALAKQDMLERAARGAKNITDDYNREAQKASEAVQSFLAKSSGLLAEMANKYNVGQESPGFKMLSDRVRQLQSDYDKIDQQSDDAASAYKALSGRFDKLFEDIPKETDKLQKAYEEAQRKIKETELRYKAINEEAEAVLSFFQRSDQLLADLESTYKNAKGSPGYKSLMASLATYRIDYEKVDYASTGALSSLKTLTGKFDQLFKDIQAEGKKLRVAQEEADRKAREAELKLKETKEEAADIQSFFQRSDKLLEELASTYEGGKNSPGFKELVARLATYRADYAKLNLTSNSALPSLKGLRGKFDKLFKNIPEEGKKLKAAYEEAQRKARAAELRRLEIKTQSDVVNDLFSRASSQMELLESRYIKAKDSPGYKTLLASLATYKSDYVRINLTSDNALSSLKTIEGRFDKLFKDISAEEKKLQADFLEAERKARAAELLKKSIQDEADAIETFIAKASGLIEEIGTKYKDGGQTPIVRELNRRLADIRTKFSQVNLTSSTALADLKWVTGKCDKLLIDIPTEDEKLRKIYEEEQRKARAAELRRQETVELDAAIQALKAEIDTKMGTILYVYPGVENNTRYRDLSRRRDRDLNPTSYNAIYLRPQNVEGLRGIKQNMEKLLADIPGEEVKISKDIEEDLRKEHIRTLKITQGIYNDFAIAASWKAEFAKSVSANAASINSIFNNEDNGAIGSMQTHLQYEKAKEAAIRAIVAAKNAEKLRDDNKLDLDNMTLEQLAAAVEAEKKGTAVDSIKKEWLIAKDAKDEAEEAEASIEDFYKEFARGVRGELVKINAIIADLTRIRETNPSLTDDEQDLYDKYFTKGKEGKTGFDRLVETQRAYMRFLEHEYAQIPTELRKAGGALDILLAHLDANRKMDKSEVPDFKRWNRIIIDGLLLKQRTLDESVQGIDLARATHKEVEKLGNLNKQQEDLALALKEANDIANALKNGQSLGQAQLLGLRLAGKQIEADEVEKEQEEQNALDVYMAAFNSIGKPALTRFAKYHKRTDGNRSNNFDLDFLRDENVGGLLGFAMGDGKKNAVSKEKALQKITIEFAIDDYMETNAVKFKDKGEAEKTAFRKDFRKCFQTTAGGQVTMGGTCTTDPQVSTGYIDKYRKEQLNRPDSQLNIQAKYIIAQIWANGDVGMAVDSTTNTNADMSINSMLSRLLSENYQPPPSLWQAGKARALMATKTIADTSVFIFGAVAKGALDILNLGSSMAGKGAIEAATSTGNGLLGMVLRSGKIYGGGAKTVAGKAGTKAASWVASGISRSTAVLGQGGTILAMAAIGGLIGGAIGCYLAPEGQKMYGAVIGGIFGGLVGVGVYALYSFTPVGIAVNTVLFIKNFVSAGVFVVATLGKAASWFWGETISAAEKRSLEPFLPEGKTKADATKADWEAARAKVKETLGNGVRDFFESYSRDPTLATKDLLSTEKGKGALYKALEANGTDVLKRLNEQYNKPTSEGGLPAHIKALIKPEMLSRSADGPNAWYKDLSEEDGNAILNALFPVSSGIKNNGGQKGGASVELVQEDMPLNEYYDKVLYYVFLSKFPLFFKGYSKEDVYLQTALDFFKFFVPLYKEADTMSLNNLQNKTVSIVACIHVPFIELSEENLERSIDLLEDIDRFDESGGTTPVRWPHIEDRDFARYSLANVAAASFEQPVVAEEPVPEKAPLEEKPQNTPIAKPDKPKVNLDNLHQACSRAINAEHRFNYKNVKDALFRILVARKVVEVCKEVKYPSCQNKQEELDTYIQDYEKIASEYESLKTNTDNALSDYKSNISQDRQRLYNKFVKDLEKIRIREIELETLESGDWVDIFGSDLTKAYKSEQGWLTWGDPTDKLTRVVNKIFEQMNVKKTQSGGSNKRNTKRKRALRKKM
jgi:hypothetical protein